MVASTHHLPAGLGPALELVCVLQAPWPCAPSFPCDVTHGDQWLPHNFARMSHLCHGAGRNQPAPRPAGPLPHPGGDTLISVQRVSPSHVWEHLWLSQLGEACCWNLVDQSQGCHQTSSSAQDSAPLPAGCPVPVSAVPRVRNLGLKPRL